MSQKVEVLVEKFDAMGVTKAQSLNVSNPLSASASDNWAAVSQKKKNRLKAMIQAKPKENSILNPIGESSSGVNAHPSPSNFMPYHPAPLGPDDIILANTVAFKFNKHQATDRVGGMTNSDYSLFSGSKPSCGQVSKARNNYGLRCVYI